MNDELLALSRDLTAEMVPVPQSGEGVCPICHSWRHYDEEMCNNCKQAVESLAFPCLQVLPISLYSKPSKLRDWLKFYKPNAEKMVPDYRRYIAATLSASFAGSGDELRRVTGGWDSLMVVPSSLDKNRVHALEEQLRIADTGYPITSPLRRTDTRLAHRVMSDHGFELIRDVGGERILVVDDVYTTGARSQSAASVLQIGGAVVVGILVIGRRINPEFNEPARLLWEQQLKRKFYFDQLFRDPV